MRAWVLFSLSVMFGLAVGFQRGGMRAGGLRRPLSQTMAASPTPTPSAEHILRLQHPGTCSGMYWRGDPFTGKSAPSNDNWPRNGALLRGTGPYDARGEQYFKVTAIQQAGTEGFKPVPEGTWMLYNQDGLLLHKI